MERKIDRFDRYMKIKHLNDNKVTVNLSLSVGTLGKSRKEGRDLSDRVVEKILNYYEDINPAWLLAGEGSMLKSTIIDYQKAAKINAPIVGEPPYQYGTPRIAETGIPFFDINVSAGINESFNDVPEIPQYYISYPPLKDCTAAFPVFGESMEPDYCAGEVVLVKEITNINSMLWGETYLIITNGNCDNLRTIKNVYISEDRQTFILRAINPRFQGDTIIPVADVVKIFLVKGKVSRKQL